MRKGKIGNCVITVIFFVLLFFGLCSISLISGIGHAVLNLLKSDQTFSDRIENFIASVDSSSTYISYEGLCKDLYSLKLVYLDKKNYVEANGSLVVRMNNGYLNSVYEFEPDETLSECADHVEELYKNVKANDAQFLYVAVPTKSMEGGFPEGIYSYVTDNTERYLHFLEERNIPTLNLKEKMDEQGISEEDAFFVTDHHWTPETGVWAVGQICKELATRYGFTYDNEIVDMQNYNRKVYPNWYLGSQGKRVGQYFTPYGADDISLIYPKFNTDLTVENPQNGEVRKGPFEDSILFKEKIEKKALYDRRRSAYAAYSGGDIAIQKIINNKANETAPRILVIRDSMAGCVTPFLSLTASELDTIDLRPNVVADPIVQSVYAYIEDFKPDYVLVIYSVTEVDTPSAFEFD